MLPMTREFEELIEVRYDALRGTFLAYIHNIPQCTTYGKTAELAIKGVQKKLKYFSMVKKLMNQAHVNADVMLDTDFLKELLSYK